METAKNKFHPAPLLRVVPWMVAGILVEDAFAPCCHPWQAAVCVMTAVLLWRWPRVQTVAIGLSVMLVGMALTARHRASLTFAETSGTMLTEAVVVSEVAEKPRSMAADLLLPASGRKVKAYFAADEHSRSLLPGDVLLLRTRIEPTEGLHIGRFDYGRHLIVNGFTGRCYVRGDNWQRQPTARHRLSSIDRLRIRALCWRHSLTHRFRTLAGHEEAAYALLAAMTLGDRSSLDKELREVYSVTGASHVLALSGLHVGIIFSLFMLFGAAGRDSLLRGVGLVTALWAFALTTGLSVSVVRSALMLTVATVFALRGSRGVTLNALCIAAIVILAVNPYALFDVGFQLSFLSVLAILLVLPVLDSLWPQGWLRRHRLLALVWSVVAVSVAAQVGTAPLVAYHFGRLPVWFVLTNLVVIPCVFAILWLGLLYLVLPLGFVGKMLLFVVNVMNGTLTAMAGWPCASIGGLHPTALQTVMVYVLIVSLYFVIRRFVYSKRHHISP